MSRSRGCGKLSHNQSKTPYCLQISNARPGKCLGGGGAASVTGQPQKVSFRSSGPICGWITLRGRCRLQLQENFASTQTQISKLPGANTVFLFPSLLPDYLTVKSSSNLLKSFIPGKEHSHSGESRNLESFR